MARESREMAEEATWEKINNSVAWKLAEALETPHPQSVAQNNITIPVYSWLLLSPELRALLVDARLVGGIGIIFGVWCGLVITWILVQLSLLVRAKAPWLRDWLRGFSQ
jgi:hypothetical protein